jgi:cytochrome c-type biogenesis protein CcmH
MRRWLPWLVLAPVLVLALVVGTRSGGGHQSVDSRVRSITSEIRCPECESQSVADSNATASVALRDEVRRRVEAGQSDKEILSFVVSKYGEQLLLKPKATGLASLVWVLPVMVLVLGAAALGAVFLRRRERPVVTATDADRVLVERARRQAAR